MSEILANLKDAINPKRRKKATPPDYDPHKRGAYADAPSDEPQLAPPGGTGASNEGSNSASAENNQARRMTAPDRSPKLATNAGFHAPQGTYGPHDSRVANVLDPRVDSDRDGRPRYGIGGYGGAAAQPVKD